MTALELSQNICKIGTIVCGTVRVSVHIMDGKTAYGTPRYLITPVSGSGQQWVNADRVSVCSQFEREEK
jgi:hypothetical protein